MLHPDTIVGFVDPRIGYGVFATAQIPAGTITWMFRPPDVRLDPDTNLINTDDLERFAFSYSGRDLILCGDIARFVNHSCDPNCCCVSELMEIAVRDIAAFEELTVDYATFVGESTFQCACSSRNCRGSVAMHDNNSRMRLIYERTRSAIPLITQVAQPLLQL